MQDRPNPNPNQATIPTLLNRVTLTDTAGSYYAALFSDVSPGIGLVLKESLNTYEPVVSTQQ